MYLNHPSTGFTPPLSTSGTQIIDSTGTPFKLACVNWSAHAL
jgi:hypothetical protein